MNTFIVSILLINSAINCLPADITAGQTATIDRRLIVNLPGSSGNQEIDTVGTQLISNSQKIPQDVELLETERASEEQSIGPVVGSLIDLIFAVSSSHLALAKEPWSSSRGSETLAFSAKEKLQFKFEKNK